MTNKLADGVPVRLAERETNAADLKSGLFYPYYSGLTGTVAKLYADGTAAVMIDPESMPAEIRGRHQKGTDAMRQKWLEGLSDEARNKLSAGEKKFSLRYTLLVGVGDLSPTGQPAQPPPPSAELAAGPAAKPIQARLDMDNAAEPARKSLAEMEADEARHLAEVAQKRKG